MKKRDKHQGYVIYLGPIYSIKDTMTSSPSEQVRAVLEKLAFEARNCNRCGGVLPELIFEYMGKEYRFTCYQITDENGKVIAKTNYKKFSEYCSGKTKK